MAFEVFDNRPHRQSTPSLTLDKYNRLYLNLLTQQLFGFDKEQGPYFLYVWYDKVNHRIGLANPDIVKLIDTRPFKFDKRFYTSFKKLVEYYRIDTDITKRYIHVGKDSIGRHVFELEGYDAPDASGQEEMIRERKQKV